MTFAVAVVISPLGEVTVTVKVPLVDEFEQVLGPGDATKVNVASLFMMTGMSPKVADLAERGQLVAPVRQPTVSGWI